MFLIFISCSPPSDKSSTSSPSDDTEEVIPVDDVEIPTEVPSDEVHADRMIDLSNFDEDLLSELLEVQINQIRSDNGKPGLFRDNYLMDAAKDHNRYQVEKDEMTHRQDIRGKSTVQDRITFYGGTFRFTAENVQYLGFTIFTDLRGQHVRTSSYSETARDLAENWKNSQGHFRNIINSNVRFVGTAVNIDRHNRALYATQVYGG